MLLLFAVVAIAVTVDTLAVELPFGTMFKEILRFTWNAVAVAINASFAAAVVGGGVVAVAVAVPAAATCVVLLCFILKQQQKQMEQQ